MVNAIHEFPDGSMMLAENDGSIDLLENHTVKPYRFPQKIVINDFLRTQGRVIASTDTAGLYELLDGTLRHIPGTSARYSYYDIASVNDSFYVGVGVPAAIRILDHRFALYQEIPQYYQFASDKAFRDSKGRIWIGTHNGLKKLSVIYGAKGPDFILSAAPFDLPLLHTAIINDMAESEQGVLWIATSRGLVEIYPDNSYRVFTKREGLPADHVACLFRDREMNLWIGTMLGLAKMPSRSVTDHYTIENGMAANTVTHLEWIGKDSLLVYQAAAEEVQLFTKGKFRALPIEERRSHVYPFIFDGYPPPPSNVYLWCSLKMKDFVLYGTDEGLHISTARGITRVKGIPSPVSYLVADREGGAWAGTRNDGLFRLRFPGGGADPRMEDFSGLVPGKSIRSLLAGKDGSIWVGTRYNGLARVKRMKGKDNYQVTLFGKKDGLMSNWIMVITEDRKGNIWVGTNLGLDKLLPIQSTYRVVNFGRLNDYYGQVHSILPLPDNTIWIGAYQGLTRVSDDSIETFHPPPLFITSVSAADSLIFPDGKTGYSLRLKHYQNSIAFEFASPSFINEDHVMYSYRLLGGSDTSWSKPAGDQAVSFASLQPGEYRFEVRTLGWNGVPGETAFFDFSISIPFWQSRWFYFILVILVAAGLYALYRLRIRQLLRIQQVRNSIASDLHDEIGSTLTSIGILSELSGKNLEKKEGVAPFLQRINEEVGNATQSLDDIIWSVNTRADNFPEMQARMRRYAEELFVNSNISYQLHFDETGFRKELDMGQRRDCYMIYKELLNNIHKHASARNVHIEMKVQRNIIHMLFMDDGKGFDHSSQSPRNGLKNLQARISRWKGELRIRSGPGQGSRFEIEIPVAGQSLI